MTVKLEDIKPGDIFKYTESERSFWFWMSLRPTKPIKTMEDLKWVWISSNRFEEHISKSSWESPLLQNTYPNFLEKSTFVTNFNAVELIKYLKEISKE